jgi:hypothetical protein
MAPLAAAHATAAPASPCCCPVTLRMSSPALERGYAASVKPAAVAMDATLCWHKLWISALVLAGCAGGLLPATRAATGAWCVYVALLAAHHTAMRSAPKAYAAARGGVILGVKAVLASCQAALVALHVLQPSHSSATYAAVLVLGAGLVMQLCTGVWWLLRCFFGAGWWWCW